MVYTVFPCASTGEERVAPAPPLFWYAVGGVVSYSPQSSRVCELNLGGFGPGEIRAVSHRYVELGAGDRR